MMPLARLLAALRDNPLVRYGSPARRLTVPRALWWLAFGASLFFSAMVGFLEVSAYNSAYLVWFVSMPVVAGLVFSAFAFPHVQREHLEDLHLAGLRGGAVIAGFLYWPVLAGLIVLVPFLVVPGLVHSIEAATGGVEWRRELIGRRLVSGIVAVVWLVLCLAVAFRCWVENPRRRPLLWVLGPLAMAANLVWFVALLVWWLGDLLGIMDQMIQYAGFYSWNDMFRWYLNGLSREFWRSDLTQWLAAALLLLAAAVELARAALATRRLLPDDGDGEVATSAGASLLPQAPLALWKAGVALVGMTLFAVGAVWSLGALPSLCRPPAHMRWDQFSVDMRYEPALLLVGAMVASLALAVACRWWWHGDARTARPQRVRSMMGIAALGVLLAAMWAHGWAEPLDSDHLLITARRSAWVFEWRLRLSVLLGVPVACVAAAAIVQMVLGSRRPWVWVIVWSALAAWVLFPPLSTAGPSWARVENVFSWQPYTGRSATVWLAVVVWFVIGRPARAVVQEWRRRRARRYAPSVTNSFTGCSHAPT